MRLSDGQARRFLALALGAAERPVDALLDRLEVAGGGWVASELARVLGEDPASFPEQLLRERPRRSFLLALKERATSVAAEAADESTRLLATAGYFLSVAAALVHHHELISLREPGEIAAVLAELASCAPSPWGAFFREAPAALEVR